MSDIRIMKTVQCVVRTWVKRITSSRYEHVTSDLERKLADGYTVVMCNKIVRDDIEFLEYILQKVVEE